MAYGETIIFQSSQREAIIRNLRECGCDDEQIAECWNSFVASVGEFADVLRQARKSGKYADLSKAAPPFLDLVQNIRATDLMIYTKNLIMVLRSKDTNGIDRATNDLQKLCEKYLDTPDEA